jgi:hypothetical protein
MTDHDVHGCARIGSRIGVLCAGLGIAVAVVMLKMMGMDDLFAPRVFLGPIGLGVLVLFVSAAVLGRKAGVFMCKHGNRTLIDAAGGLVVAFGSIAMAVFAGSVSSLVAVRSLKDVATVLLVPQIVVGMFGGIPAIVLGVLYGFLVRWRLLKLTY